MLDKEVHIRFTLRGVLSRAWVLPVLTVLLFLIFVWSISWPWGEGVLTDWVQALGSVGALFYAIWIASRDTRIRENRQAVAVQVIKRLVLRLDLMAAILGNAPADRSKWSPNVAAIAEAKAQIESLTDFDLYQLPTPEHVTVVLALIKNHRRLLDHYERGVMNWDTSISVDLVKHCVKKIAGW